MHRHRRMRDHRISHVAICNRGSGRREGRGGKLWPGYEGPWMVCPENLVWDANLSWLINSSNTHHVIL